jgi:hypothetical protein
MVSTSSRPSQKQVWVWREENLIGLNISAKDEGKKYPPEGGEAPDGPL